MVCCLEEKKNYIYKHTHTPIWFKEHTATYQAPLTQASFCVTLWGSGKTSKSAVTPWLQNQKKKKFHKLLFGSGFFPLKSGPSVTHNISFCLRQDRCLAPAVFCRKEDDGGRRLASFAFSVKSRQATSLFFLSSLVHTNQPINSRSHFGKPLPQQQFGFSKKQVCYHFIPFLD